MDPHLAVRFHMWSCPAKFILSLKGRAQIRHWISVSCLQNQVSVSAGVAFAQGRRDYILGLSFSRILRPFPSR